MKTRSLNESKAARMVVANYTFQSMHLVIKHGHPEGFMCAPVCGASHVPSVYTRRSSEHARPAKSDGYGLLAHRPQSASCDSGTTPPRIEATPFGPMQKRDYGTHRPVKSRLLLDVTDRGLLWLEMVIAGQVQSLRGSGWPPVKGIAWIRVSK